MALMHVKMVITMINLEIEHKGSLFLTIIAMFYNQSVELEFHYIIMEKYYQTKFVSNWIDSRYRAIIIKFGQICINLK